MRPIDGNEAGAKIQAMYIRREMDYGGENEFCRGMRKALRIVEEAPTIETEPEKGWISVEDRLPDENQKCLVYRDIDNDLKITTGIWHSDRKTFDGLRHGTRIENTIAWMPLPEPPKDGDSE